MRVRILLVLPLVLWLTGCAALRGAAGGGLQSPPPSPAPSPTPETTPVAGVIPWINGSPAGFHQGLAVPVGDNVSPPAETQPAYWSAALTAPSDAKAGQTLEYEVTLTNIFSRALAFPNGCPGYMEALAAPSSWTTGKEWFLPNCGPIRTVQPGASVRFAMRIEVPATTPPGTLSLLWGLDTGLANYGGSATDLTVTR